MIVDGQVGNSRRKTPEGEPRMLSTRIGDEHHFVIRFEREVVTNRGRVESAIGASLVEERHGSRRTASRSAGLR